MLCVSARVCLERTREREKEKGKHKIVFMNVRE